MLFDWTLSELGVPDKGKLNIAVFIKVILYNKHHMHINDTLLIHLDFRLFKMLGIQYLKLV